MDREEPPPESLSTFVNRKDSSEWSIELVNPTRPEQIREMAEDLFGSLGEATPNTEIEGLADDLVLLKRDGEVVASSLLQTIEATLLLVNSDIYTTGAKSLKEITVPDVVEELSDTVFTLSGYPRANTEKLVLTLVSRHIEQQAAQSQTGTLRTSFQRLSRLDDERGTHEVYETLGQLSDLETHVYGVPDWIPPAEMGLSTHRVRQEEIQNTWFVVHCTETAGHLAMLALKDGSNIWRGYWTTDATEVRSIDDYIVQSF